MPFQVDGVNWLCHNWNIDQNCILADEMGLVREMHFSTYVMFDMLRFYRERRYKLSPSSGTLFLPSSSSLLLSSFQILPLPTGYVNSSAGHQGCASSPSTERRKLVISSNDMNSFTPPQRVPVMQSIMSSSQHMRRSPITRNSVLCSSTPLVGRCLSLTKVNAVSYPHHVTLRSLISLSQE